MDTQVAQLPEIDQSDDKVLLADDAIVMLDGASAFMPVQTSTSVYANCLGRHLQEQLRLGPTRDLRAVLFNSIENTAHELGLTSGRSPSSTVTIVRQRGQQLDLLVLGDNIIELPDEIITDDRMDQLNLAPRRKYRQRLADGNGYDDEHRRLLRELQTLQAEKCNKPGGYWIAEAVPHAAEHAVLHQREVSNTPWAVLATDGAYNTMQHLQVDTAELVGASRHVLAATLRKCQEWESADDPSAVHLPRAKRHDDKSVAVLKFH